ncbi:Mth938-like domain-containing protein [Hydromonas duriensis]|uniref:Xcc1710-like domain-containing protein n=1 Tax=Hydromonas duriensis TaxID=1527608 RepID=A0A4R6Y9R8_9BURK|nr:Mth938-like domain-containing protein [Hydromonas duriensis]TDR32214.1 uncharacterized protein DFR44_105101 [Hydromonas duriensis]
MHFQPELNPHLNTITACDHDAIKINQTPYASSIWVTPEGEVKILEASHFSELTEELFETVSKATPEVVLVGTGSQQHFIHPAKLAPLNRARIGVECMSSQAACRTYNVLMGEGRRVLALILLPD